MKLKYPRLSKKDRSYVSYLEANIEDLHKSICGAIDWINQQEDNKKKARKAIEKLRKVK